ncbi:MAG: hypothetical protein FJ125_06490 [Deltaproteobacteria bacterium]|nr:hypothetical protein [Deltaproteobacteria bacterium]
MTTIATPHRGSMLADVVLGLIPGPQRELIDILVADLHWSVDTLRDVSVDWVTRSFNQANRNDPRVHYQSWAGVTGLLNGDLPNAVMAPLHLIHQGLDGPNDGMVALRSARWGRFRGTIPADHYAEVGHPLGMNGIFQHEQFFRDLVRELREMGY